MPTEPLSNCCVGDYRVWLNPDPPMMCSAFVGLTADAVHVMQRLGEPVSVITPEELIPHLIAGFRVPFASLERVRMHPWLPRIELYFRHRQLAWQATDEAQRESFYATLKSALGEEMREERAPESTRSIILSSALMIGIIAFPSYALLLAAQDPSAARGAGRNVRRNLLVGCADSLGTTGIVAIATVLVAIVVAGAVTRLGSRRDVVQLVRRAAAS